MTDIEGFLTIYGHSDNLLNNKIKYRKTRLIVSVVLIDDAVMLTAKPVRHFVTSFALPFPFQAPSLSLVTLNF